MAVVRGTISEEPSTLLVDVDKAFLCQNIIIRANYEQNDNNEESLSVHYDLSIVCPLLSLLIYLYIQ